MTLTPKQCDTLCQCSAYASFFAMAVVEQHEAGTGEYEALFDKYFPDDKNQDDITVWNAFGIDLFEKLLAKMKEGR